MAAPDPVDVRLLSVVAEMGRAAVHEVAARVNMDPRDVAARLVALSGRGLPLIVGVECDQAALRSAVAAAGMWSNYPGQQGAQGTPSGVYPVNPAQGTASGPYQVQGTASGTYQVQGTPSGPYPAQGTPSGSYGAPAGPPGARAPLPQGAPSGPYPPGSMPSPAGPPSMPFATQPQGPQTVDPAVNTWGPPQTSSWTRGDQPPGAPQPNQPMAAPGAQVATQPPPNGAAATPALTGKVGETLNTEGLEGERLAIQLVEVVDPADFLFTAAGYRLQPGERSVVVHTELTNTGAVPFATLPDLYLVLIGADGETVSKAPVSLSSRPPHRIGVRPGETAGGHTVYVLPETTTITGVRWSPRPDELKRSITWSVEN